MPSSYLIGCISFVLLSSIRQGLVENFAQIVVSDFRFCSVGWFKFRYLLMRIVCFVAFSGEMFCDCVSKYWFCRTIPSVIVKLKGHVKENVIDHQDCRFCQSAARGRSIQNISVFVIDVIE